MVLREELEQNKADLNVCTLQDGRMMRFIILYFLFKSKEFTSKSTDDRFINFEMLKRPTNNFFTRPVHFQTMIS